MAKKQPREISAEQLAAGLIPFLSGAPTRDKFSSNRDYLTALQQHFFSRAEHIFTIAGRSWSWDEVYEVGDELAAKPHSKRKSLTRVEAAAGVAICADDLIGNDSIIDPDDRAAAAAAAIQDIARFDLHALGDVASIERRMRSRKGNAAKTRSVEARLDRINKALKSGVRASPTSLLHHFGMDKTDANREKMRADLERIRDRQSRHSPR
jgi:hypothetical protein